MRTIRFPAVFNLTQSNGKYGWTFNGDQPNGSAGYSVRGLGDVTGDGIDDAGTTAPAVSSYSRTKNGEVYIFAGKQNLFFNAPINPTSLLSLGGLRIIGNASYDYLGEALSRGCDVNGDKINDVIICSYKSGPGGKCWIVYMKPNPSGILDLANPIGFNVSTITAKNTGDDFGYSVDCAGDINKDGFGDVVFGERHASPSLNLTQAGGMRGLLGKSTLPSTPHLLATELELYKPGDHAGDMLGSSVRGLGDVNKDGVGDFGVGAPKALGGDGLTELFFGQITYFRNITRTISPNLRIIGEHVAGESGCSLAGTDLDGDGTPDPIVGAHFVPVNAQLYHGATYAFPGGAYLNNITVFYLNTTSSRILRLYGEGSGDENGFEVDGCDFDNDGYGDVVSGSLGATLEYYAGGKGYIRFGGPNIWSIASVSLSTTNGLNGISLWGRFAINQYTGYSIACVGDLNNDGIIDVGVGAFGTSGYQGAAFFVYGDTTPVLIQNQLPITEHQSTTLTSSYLSATRAGRFDPSILFKMSALRNGCFTWVNNPNLCITSFLQANRTQIQFIQKDQAVYKLSFAPTFNITLNGQRLALDSTAQIGHVLFTAVDNPPVWGKPGCQFAIKQGIPLRVSAININVTDPDTPRNFLRIIINSNFQVHFSNALTPKVPISNFTVNLIDQKEILLDPDDTSSPKQLILFVSDGVFTVGPQTCQITQANRPQILRFQIDIDRSMTTQTIVPTQSNNFLGIDTNGTPDSALIWNLTCVDFTCNSLASSTQSSELQFSANTITPTQKTSSQFTQANIDSGLISCIANYNPPLQVPQCNATLLDAVGLLSFPMPLLVNLIGNPTSPSSNSNIWNTVTYIAPIIGFVGFALTVIRFSIYCRERYKDISHYDAKVVKTKEGITEFNKITRCSCCDYRSIALDRKFYDIATNLVRQLEDKGVEFKYLLEHKETTQLYRRIVGKVVKDTLFPNRTSCAKVGSFFKCWPDVTPRKITPFLETIAEGIYQSLLKNRLISGETTIGQEGDQLQVHVERGKSSKRLLAKSSSKRLSGKIGGTVTIELPIQMGNWEADDTDPGARSDRSASAI